MAFEWERVRPYLKWGLSGGVIGAAVSLFASVVRQPGWPGDVEWVPSMGTMSWYGFLFGVLGGATLALIAHLADRSSESVQNRIRAEKKDPKMVVKMYLDIESGEETSAYQSIALLANYMDPIITKNMLSMVANRLERKDVFTTDRLSLVRHAVKCITATGSQSNIEQLRPYASDMDSDIGVQVRRMGLNRGGGDYSLK